MSYWESATFDPPAHGKSVILQMFNGKFQYYAIGQYDLTMEAWRLVTNDGFGAMIIINPDVDVIRWKEIGK